MNILLSNIVGFLLLGNTETKSYSNGNLLQPWQAHPKARNIQGHRIAVWVSIKTPGMEDNKQIISQKKEFLRENVN